MTGSPAPGRASAVASLVRAALEEGVAAAESRGGGVVALDAGCGRVSALRPFRDRITRLVGADIHAPGAPLPHLDEFRILDLCGPAGGFEDGSFDVILSSFTLEHFADPAAALSNMRRWLRPGGVLVATTVNRRHPFVWAYLSLPAAPRRRLQPVIKASAADAHPLVGRCNDPAAVRRGLEAAGFSRISLWTVGHLERAWGRSWLTGILGRVGDALAAPFPSRRSTIVAVAWAPET